MILGLDLHDGAVRALTAREDGQVVARDAQAGVPAQTAVAAVRALAGHGAARLGVAVADPEEPDLGTILTEAARVAGTTDAPRVITRGTAIALAEQWCGAAQGARHVAALAVDETVHAGIVIDGRPFEGAHGWAASAGWLALNPVEREDYRKLGGLEAEIGAAGIVRRLIWRLKAGDVSRVLDLAGGDMGAITERQIFEAARAGDGVAISVVRDTARYVGMAVGALVAILDPEVVVLGGVLADAGDLLIQPSRVEAARRMPARAAETVRIVPARLADDGGALGAARAAMLAA